MSKFPLIYKGYVLCWDMKDSTTAISRDFDQAISFISDISKCAQEIDSRCEFLEDTGDGQILLYPAVTSLNEISLIANQIISSSQRLSNSPPRFSIRVAVGSGELYKTPAGAKGPILWKLHDAMKHSPNQDLVIL